MSHQDLRERVQQRPFQPFRMVLTEGTTYEVRHPELIMLGKRAAVIGISRDAAQTLFDSTVLVDLFHIVRLEALDGAAAGSGH